MSAIIDIYASKNQWENGAYHGEGFSLSVSIEHGRAVFQHHYWSNGNWCGVVDWAHFVKLLRLTRGFELRKAGRVEIIGVHDGDRRTWFCRGRSGGGRRTQEREKNIVAINPPTRFGQLLRDFFEKDDDGALGVLHDWLIDVGLMAYGTPHAEPAKEPTFKIRTEERQVKWIGPMYSARVVRYYPAWEYDQTLFLARDQRTPDAAMDLTTEWLQESGDELPAPVPPGAVPHPLQTGSNGESLYVYPTPA